MLTCYTIAMERKGDRQLERTQSSDHYRSDEVGRVLLRNIPTATVTQAARDVLARVSQQKDWDSVDYVYVVTKRGKLRGVLSIKELLRTAPTTRMKLYVREVFSVHPHTKLHTAAQKALHANVKSLPVIDDDGVFLGAIGSDEILSALDHLTSRQFLMTAGVHSSERILDVFHAHVSQLVTWRLPWLLAGVFGGLFLTTIVDGFEHSLETVTHLAVFIPVMVYIGAAVGNQAQVLFLRGLALSPGKTDGYLVKEFLVDVVIAVLVAPIFGIFAQLITRSIDVSMVITVSLFLIIATAGLIAVFTAMLFRRFTKDPALGGGPMTTVIQDALSLLIYLSVATVMLF